MGTDHEDLGSIRKGEIVAVSPRDLNGEAEIDAVAPTHSFRAHLQSSSCSCSPTTPRICGAASILTQLTLSRTRKQSAMEFHVAHTDCRVRLGGLPKPDATDYAAGYSSPCSLVLRHTDPRSWYNTTIGANLSKRSRKGNVGT